MTSYDIMMFITSVLLFGVCPLCVCWLLFNLPLTILGGIDEAVDNSRSEQGSGDTRL